MFQNLRSRSSSLPKHRIPKCELLAVREASQNQHAKSYPEVIVMAASRTEVIELLKTAYSMELETVMNYLANSTNLDGVRAEEIKKSLAADITEELGHATQLAHRIKQLGGLTPGSNGVKLGNQTQPTDDTTDVIGVIEAVIAAEALLANITRKSFKPPKGTTT